MAITTRDGIINALGSNYSRILIEKASLSNQTAGRAASLWRATGQPGQAAIPTTSAVCTSALLGAISFTNQTDPAKSYLDYLSVTSGNNAQSFEIHDRLCHMGGLVLNVTTAQTVTGLDLSTIGISTDRRGAANYSDIAWWLEVYSDGGATASNATINVTYDDASTGNLNTQAVGGTIRAGNLFPLTPLIPTAQQGKFIRGINSVTLSASTTVAGNFGFTATRPKFSGEMLIANMANVFDWSRTGRAKVYNDACNMLIVVPSTTSSGTLRGTGKITHG